MKGAKYIKTKIVNSKMLKRWIEKYTTQDSVSEDIYTRTHKLEYPIVSANYPEVLNIELTNECIMKCSMCPRTYLMTREKGFMELNLFKKIIDEIVSYKVKPKETIWLHHFGESLLHPDFDKAVAYGISKGLDIGMSVNPLALTEEKAVRLFQAKPTRIYMMMDGDSNETFYKLRGVKDVYDISVKNAVNAFKIKEKYSPETVLDIVIIDNPAFKDIIDNAEDFWKKEHNIQVSRKPFWNWNGDVDEINQMDCTYKTDKICYFPWKSICVTWNGLVVSCCADYNNLCVIGDVCKNSLLEIWNDEPIKELRKELKSGKISNKLCSKCAFTKHVDNEMGFANKCNLGECIKGENSVIYPEAQIYNHLGAETVTIGKNTHIRGKLLNYPCGGNIKIGDYCYVGEGCNIFSACNIEIGNNVLIAHNVDIFDHNTHPNDPVERHKHFKTIITKGHPAEKVNWNEKPVKICDNAWIGAKAIILKGVTIGECAIVSAGSVVTKDVQPYTIVAGNPAKKIKMVEPVKLS